MAIQKSDKVQKLQTKLNDVRAEATTLTEEITELEKALDETVKNFAMDDATKEDVKAGQEMITEKKQQLSDCNVLMQSLEEAKNLQASEEIPKIKGLRKRSINKIQKEINEQEAVVREARNAFLRELAKVGQIKRKAGTANRDYQNALQEAGAEVDFHDNMTVHTTKVFSPGGYTAEENTLGITADRQESAVREGTIPKWAQEKKGE